MNRSTLVRGLRGLILSVLMVRAAEAASLQPVSNWGSVGVPTYISMYIYVPDRLATNPPILVVSHYCGGTASGVFGEAQGGGIVAASDRYGFLMVFPQTSNNCWDVGSTKSLTHDGGGDTQAVAEMVKYALTKYNANANRVYAVGTSSGAMMTEALLALYPDIFKGGSEFSGVPAGCWSASYSASIQWSGPCAGGQVTHTAQQWGDMVRAMYIGYSGHRPRIQLWHGMADATINFNNQTEAIKEWTNVLGLGANPTSTTMVTLNTHPWTRQTWQDSCGAAVLDAWAEVNGPHGTDANLNAMYVIPFLALDKSGDVDPVLAACPPDGGAAAGRDGGNDGPVDRSNDVAGAGGSVGAGGTAGAAGAAGGGAGSTSAQGTGGSPGAGAGGSRGTSGDAGGGTGGRSTADGGAVDGGASSGSGARGCSCALGASTGGADLDAAGAAVLALCGLVRRRRRVK